MILVDAAGVTIQRARGAVLENVSVTVQSGDRLGVVGHNGAGKSTLLAVLTGELAPDAGQVRQPAGVTIAQLAQQPIFEETATPDDIVGTSWEAAAALDRLGIGDRRSTPVGTMSGGERRRVALALALVKPADLLVLDEPTNHLDIDAIDWLEERLSQFTGGLVLVTHDRHLLDAVTNRVVEVDSGNLYHHDGGYRSYLEGRADRIEADEKAETVRRNLARREKEWLLRGAPARTRKPKAHRERAEALQVSGEKRGLRDDGLDLHQATPRLGDIVIELEGVQASIEGRVLIEDLTVRLDPRERLGIVGPNGTGKSTLLDVMARRREPQAGTVIHGTTVKLGYFDQMGRDLDPGKRVIDAFTQDKGEADWTDKALLERFWFDSATQYSPIGDLSGGERRRLQLVMLLASQPNVMLFDEPTNDLDLDTLRALEDHLDDWPGALVVVSHDRAFLERVVTDVIVVDESPRPTRIPGGLAAWVETRRGNRRRGHASGRSASASSGPDKSAPKSSTQSKSTQSKSTLRHRLKSVEKDLNRATATVEKLSAELQTASDHEDLARIGAELKTAQTELNETEETWVTISMELEELGR